MRRHAFAGAVLYLFDAHCVGQGGLSALFAVGFCLLGVLQSVARLVRRQGYPGSPLLIAGWYGGISLATFVSVVLHQQISQKRAEVVVSALNRYRAQHLRYPRSLSDLVPGFLLELPHARATLLFRDFDYREVPVSLKSGQFQALPILSFFILPPFGRQVYDFKLGRWESSF